MPNLDARVASGPFPKGYDSISCACNSVVSRESTYLRITTNGGAVAPKHSTDGRGFGERQPTSTGVLGAGAPQNKEVGLGSGSPQTFGMGQTPNPRPRTASRKLAMFFAK